MCSKGHWLRKVMLKPASVSVSLVRSGAATSARAEEIHVLSGAAVEPGLIPAADMFRERTGSSVIITFATTPEMRRLIAADATPDVTIAPPVALDEFAKSEKVDSSVAVSLGRVGIGVVVRDGATMPDVSTTDALKRAVLDADSVIYNRASSGLYVERLLQRLGLADQIQAKTRRFNGTDMIDPLINGEGMEIGFMPVAQILHCRGRGLRLVAPLPSSIQNYTNYLAAPAPNSEGGHSFVRFLATPEAKGVFADAGIE
jgi:molybdate transport system substrate-binding protein